MSQKVTSVEAAKAVVFQLLPFRMLVASATGQVDSTGWSHVRLSPYFYIAPPKDGVWDFNLIADAPQGVVGDVMLPVAAHIVLPAPDWLKGIRVHAQSNKVEAMLADKPQKAVAAPGMASLRASAAPYRQTLASYDDSHQPTGNVRWDGVTPHFEMKKLHHTLTLVVDGPDRGKIEDCVRKAVTAGLIAAIIAVYVTGGAALSAAVSAFLSSLQSCLGDSFTATVEDDSHWEYWYT